MNVCLYVFYRTANYAFDNHLQKSVLHKSTKVSEKNKFKNDDRKVKVNLTPMLTFPRRGQRLPGHLVFS